jgi:hypothetical protein
MTNALNAFYNTNYDCLDARKFVVFEMVTGEEYESCEMDDKEDLLAAIIYLVESQKVIDLGRYKITFTDSTKRIELAGLKEDIEKFTAWDIIPGLKADLEKNPALKDSTTAIVFYYLNSGLRSSMSEYLAKLATLHYYIVVVGYTEEEAFDLLFPDTKEEERGLFLTQVKSLTKPCKY